MAAPTRTFYLTAEGKQRLQTEFKELTGYLQVIGGRLSRPHPWRKNNFEDADIEISRDELQSVNRRLDELSEILQYSRPLVSPESAHTVQLGCHVVVTDEKNTSRFSFELVDTIESNPGSGRISIKAPLGRALLGRKAGERVDVATPLGLRTFNIHKVYA